MADTKPEDKVMEENVATDDDANEEVGTHLIRHDGCAC
jgi:hypothetical protein